MKKIKFRKPVFLWVNILPNLKNNFDKKPAFLLLILLLPLLQIISCKKEADTILESNAQPLFLGGGSIPDMELSYDVVIQRFISFQNGIDNNSPGWKKLQAVPEKELYSMEITVENGDFHLVQDDIIVQSLLADKIPQEDKIGKMEVLNGVCTTYNPQGSVISSQAVAGMAEDILEGINEQLYNTPVDTNLLIANGATFFVQGNSITISYSIANGDESNSIKYLDLNTGATLLSILYDDGDPTKLVTMATHQYNANGTLEKSIVSYYDYLIDGDIRRIDEQRNYSNFLLNFL